MKQKLIKAAEKKEKETDIIYLPMNSYFFKWNHKGYDKFHSISNKVFMFNDTVRHTKKNSHQNPNEGFPSFQSAEKPSLTLEQQAMVLVGHHAHHCGKHRLKVILAPYS